MFAKSAIDKKTDVLQNPTQTIIMNNKFILNLDDTLEWRNSRNGIAQRIYKDVLINNVIIMYVIGISIKLNI